MIDYAKRMRSPALVAVLAVIGVFVLISIGHFALLVSSGLSLPAAAQMAGSASPSLVWIFSAVALALACVLVRPVLPTAQRLVSAAAVVVGVATVVAFAFWVIGIFGGLSLGVVLGVLGGLVETAFKAACAMVLWRLRGLGADAQARLESSTPSTGPDGGQPPVWHPEQAVGLQWSRAGDAATGGAAASAPALPQRPPEPERRQLWSRGGLAPEQVPELPWTTAAQAAGGQAAGPPEDLPAPQDRPRRQAPDWTPAQHPPEQAT